MPRKRLEESKHEACYDTLCQGLKDQAAKNEIIAAAVNAIEITEGDGYTHLLKFKESIAG